MHVFYKVRGNVPSVYAYACHFCGGCFCCVVYGWKMIASLAFNQTDETDGLVVEFTELGLCIWQQQHSDVDSEL